MVIPINKDYYPGENYISHRMEPVVQSFSGECIRIGEMK